MEILLHQQHQQHQQHLQARMEVLSDRVIFKGENNKYITILRNEIDKYVIQNSKTVIDQFEFLEYLPEFLQANFTIIPVAKHIVLSYSVSKKVLLVIPQNKKSEYIYYKNVDKQKIISFICNIDSLRI
jgi:hypothetical protein